LHNVKKLQLLSRVALIAPAFLVVAMAAASATTTNGFSEGGSSFSLPWESALGSLAQALTGTTAKVIAVIAIFIAGVALVMGEDLGQFARRLLMIVIAVAFLVGAGSFILPFVSGASIF
jgi:type IV secretory pathway VirB2 component (pilin)